MKNINQLLTKADIKKLESQILETKARFLQSGLVLFLILFALIIGLYK